MRKSFVKGALILSIAPIITQFFSFLVLPIITRIYDPYYFGIYSSVASFAGVISVLQGFGYNQAIILPKSDLKAKIIYNICIMFTLLLSIVCLIIILLTPIDFINKYIPKIVFDFKYSILALITLHGLYSSLLYINIRMGNYKIIAFSRVLRVIINKFTVIALGLFIIVSPSNLVYADIFASIAVSLALLMGTKKIFFKNIIDIKSVKNILIEYRQFPAYNMPSDIVFRFKQAAVIFLFLNFYNADIVGYYGMALLILTIPTTVIGSAISEVFYNESAKNNSREDLKKTLLEMLTLMLSSCLIIFIILALFSDSLIPFLLGSNWSKASTTVSIIVIISLSDFIVGPFLNTFKILKIQKYILAYQFMVLICSLFTIWLGTKFDNYLYSFLFYSLINFLIGTSILILIFKIVKIRLKSLMILIKIILNIIPSLIIIIFYKYYNFNLSVYYDFLIIFLSLGSNYYLNYNYIPVFKDISNLLIINPLVKIWEKK